MGKEKNNCQGTKSRSQCEKKKPLYIKCKEKNRPIKLKFQVINVSTINKLDHS